MTCTISQHNVNAWFMYVWVKPDTVITIREEDGQPTVNLVSLSAPTCSNHILSPPIPLSRYIAPVIALLHPAASESELRRSGDSWHELGVHQGYRGKHRSGKYKIGDQLSLVLVLSGTVFSWGRWTRDVKGDFSLADSSQSQQTSHSTSCPQHWLHWIRQGSNTKLSPLLWMNKTRSYTFYHVLSAIVVHLQRGVDLVRRGKANLPWTKAKQQLTCRSSKMPACFLQDLQDTTYHKISSNCSNPIQRLQLLQRSHWCIHVNPHHRMSHVIND